MSRRKSPHARKQRRRREANGKTGDVTGEVNSRVFKVADVQAAALGVLGAATRDAIMPNACGPCHEQYPFGLQRIVCFVLQSEPASRIIG